MKRFIAPIFFMIVSSLVYISYIEPTYVSINNLRAKKAVLEEYIVKANEAKINIDKLAKIEESFPPNYIVRLRTLLPDTIDSTRLIVDVNAFALLDGLHISTPAIAVSSGDKRSSLPYVKHTISFSVKAPYATFRTFVSDLEHNLSLRDTSALEFSSQEKDDEVAKYRNPELIPHIYNLTLITYSLH